MFLLAENSADNIKFVLHPRNYTQLYNKLKTVLDTDEYMFFARPDVFTTASRWSYEGEVRTEVPIDFDKLDESLKPQIAALMLDLQDRISDKLSKHREFKHIYKDMFMVSSVSDIKVIETAEGKLIPILTQWGCKSMDSILPATVNNITRNIPLPEVRNVILDLRYSDNVSVLNYQLEAQKIPMPPQILKSDAQGRIHLGKCTVGAQVKVFKVQNENLLFEQLIQINAGSEIYTVKIPSFADAEIKVINQHNELQTNIALELEHAGKTQTLNTGDNGIIICPQLQVGTQINIRTIEGEEPEKTFEIARSGNEFVLQIQTEETPIPPQEEPEPIPIPEEEEQQQQQQTPATPTFDIQIRIIDAQRQSLADYPILITYAEVRKDFYSDSAGHIQLEGNIEIGSKVELSDWNHLENSQVFTVTEGHNQWTFQIKDPVPESVTVLLLDQKGAPMTNILMEFALQSGKINNLTDSKGTVVIPYAKFAAGEKIMTKVHLMQGQEASKNKNTVTKAFTFNPNEINYTLQLKDRKPWLIWFFGGLLLLLLPLLLFIPFSKTLIVKLEPAEKAQPQTVITLSYKNSNFEQVINQNSEATFEGLSYNLYELIMGSGEQVKVAANQQPCYSTGMQILDFDTLASLHVFVLPLNAISTAMDFKVVDAEDNQPLPDAQIVFNQRTENAYERSEARTEADGRVQGALLQCAEDMQIIARKEGYIADTLTAKDIETISGDVDLNRLLRLKPIKQNLRFYVNDCKTGEPLPNANVIINFDIEGKNEQTTARTNVNGIGKGEYENAYSIAKVQLAAQKQYYIPAEFDNNNISVADFMQLKREERTICLEPDGNPLTFKNTSFNTGRPIPGTRNIAIIARAEQLIRRDTVMSNANGYFTIGGLNPEDLISIQASHRPRYQDNRNTINRILVSDLLSANEQKRTIPLKDDRPAPAPCNAPPQEAGGQGIIVREFNMRYQDVKFSLEYDMFTLPDQLIIYCGRGESGRILYDSRVPIAGRGSIPIEICRNSTWITIKIIGNDAGTDWTYKFVCD